MDLFLRHAEGCDEHNCGTSNPESGEKNYLDLDVTGSCLKPLSTVRSRRFETA